MQPNGKVEKLRASADEERQLLTNKVIGRWVDYCERNWITPNDDNPYSPENKVKAFLSSQGYFLILGNTEGVETDYKRIMRGSREIPISSCPSYIEDSVYSTGPSLKTVDNTEGFQILLDAVDAKAEKLSGYYKKKKSSSKKEPTPFCKLQNILHQFGIDSTAVIHARVDTDNVFEYKGSRYQIHGIPQYEAKDHQGEPYYTMDRVICVNTPEGTIFYDMNLNVICQENIERK